MNIRTIEIIAKKTAMATGVDQNILTKNKAYTIQPVTATIPKDWTLYDTVIAGIDLLGIAGQPTIHGKIKNENLST